MPAAAPQYVLWRNHEAVKMDSHSIAEIIKQKPLTNIVCMKLL